MRGIEAAVMNSDDSTRLFMLLPRDRFSLECQNSVSLSNRIKLVFVLCLQCATQWLRFRCIKSVPHGEGCSNVTTGSHYDVGPLDAKPPTGTATSTAATRRRRHGAQ